MNLGRGLGSAIGYPMPLKPVHIRSSIVYINQTTITAAGEKFFRQAQ
jgi:hypothetical protein